MKLLDGLGLDGDELPSRSDAANWPSLRARFAERFALHTRDEWAAKFAGTDACVAPVLSLGEAPHHPHNVARARSSNGAASCSRRRRPASIAHRPASDRLPPLPGEHTEAVLTELGYAR